MNCFACCFHVFLLCFYCRNMYIWYISHVYTKIQMYHILNMKCTVLLVLSYVFTVFSLHKHVFLVHFTCLYQNTHVLYILLQMHSFASVLMCFNCVFTAETCTFDKFHMYTKIHIIHEMHSFASVLMCFYCVYTAETCTFGTFHMDIPKYTCVILCFHCVFIAETWIIGTFDMYTKIQMYHIFYIKCTVLLVISCVFTVFSLQKHVLLVHFTFLYQNTHVPYILHEMHSFASVLVVFTVF
jgi:hypothetical protein